MNVLSNRFPRLHYAPAQAAGVFACLGAISIPFAARYYSDDGMPLVTAEEAAVIGGVQPGTVYKWTSRGFLTVRGLGDLGESLWRADEVANVRATPRQREKVAA